MDKPLLIVDIDDANSPEFREWLVDARKHFDVVVRPIDQKAFLIISSRAMQCRGNWQASWLRPEWLKDWKPWYAKRYDCGS